MSAEHDRLGDDSGLYVLGALALDDRLAFEVHLATCPECQAEVRSLGAVVAALPYAATDAEPPSHLRDRVLRAATATREPSHVVPFESRARTADSRGPRGSNLSGWLAAAASLLVAAGVGMYAMTLRARLDGVQGQLVSAVARLQDTEQQLQTATTSTSSARASLALLTAPDALDLRLNGQAVAPAARGRAFVSRSRGLLFAATNLPPLPNNRIYQLWFLTPGAPVSAGLLRPDEQGSVTVRFDVAADAPVPTGMAVSIEPEGGLPAPTGELYLVGQ